ncbi:hypothetical protein THRCLA_06117 [Thraustotheca clavata]|uniref:Tail specific protease domain-containing protein n=1 Tax=Thraustotheca clavata TaxID=74557 RepID=A0A1V9ZQJ2_9STRA|nr:hypothetical protein THRCLA_06117 [Thraustotheca clavata]
MSYCVTRLPYNATEKAELIKYYRLALPQYVYENIAKKSHPFGPYQLPAVDLQEGLNKIESKKYTNDAEMQEDFYQLFAQLHDAHTPYHKPNYYYNYYTLQPISIMSTLYNNAQVIKISSVDKSEVEAYATLYNESSQPDFDVEGWQITEIDGVPALDALRSFADNNIGVLKDNGSRFNLAVSGYKTGRGWFIFRPMGVFGVPTKQSVTYTLQNPSTQAKKKVTYNWIGMNIDGSKMTTSTVQGKNFETIFQKLLDHFIRQELYKKPNAVEFFDSYSTSASVLRINTFSGRDDDFTSQFANNITKALTTFTQSKREKLIIDLTGNGGGSICLGYSLLRYLFPSNVTAFEGQGPHQEGIYRARHSSLTNVLATVSASMLKFNPSYNSFLDPTQFYNSKTRRQFMDASWLSNKEDTVLGDMSQSIYRGCASMYTYFPASGISFQIDPKNLIVVSQGYCGSTCAVFTSYIQAHKLAKTVALGGYYNKAQQLFAFPGGQVGDVGDYIELADSLKIHSKYESAIEPLIPRVPTSGRYNSTGFTYLSIWPWNKDDPSHLPLEYTFVPADYSIMYPGHPTDYQSIYSRILKVTA